MPGAEITALFVGLFAAMIAVRSPYLSLRVGSILIWALAAPALLYAARYASSVMLGIVEFPPVVAISFHLFCAAVTIYGLSRVGWFFDDWATVPPKGAKWSRATWKMKFERAAPFYVVSFFFLVWSRFPRAWSKYEIGATTIALGIGAVLAVFFFNRSSARELALTVTPYLTYSGEKHGAAGTWRPTRTLASRRPLSILGIATAAVLAITYGLIGEARLSIDSILSYLSLPTVLTSVTGQDPMLSSFQALLLPVFQFVWVILAPLPIGIAIVSLAGAPLVLLARASYEILEAPGPSAEPQWPLYVERLTKSSDPLEREHLFLGTEPELDFPILLHKPLLREHCYIVGDSGSGKTSLGIMPILRQLLPDRPPLVILDLKGDMAMFEMVRQMAEANNQRFLFFTPERGRASCFFNPFQSFGSENRTVIQLCQLFLDALSLNHGEGYGRSYFSRRARALLFDAMTTGERPPVTFPELYERLKILAASDPVTQKDTFELVSTIQAMAQYPQLLTNANVEPDPAHTIHMPTLIENGDIAYFWLPSAIESMTAREIGKLALFALLSAAIDRQRERPGEPLQQTYLVIDEFQRLAGDNFKIVLEQARSFGIGAILANQSFADLQTPAGDLRSTVQTNTRAKMYFSVNDIETAEFLSKISGDDIAVQRSYGFTSNQSFAPDAFGATRGHGSTDSFSPTIRPRLSVSDIRRYSDAPSTFLLYVSRGSGYTQFHGHPIPVASEWPVTKQQYDAWSRATWPTIEGAVVAAPLSPDTLTDADVERQLAGAHGVVLSTSTQDIEIQARQRAARHRNAMRQLSQRYNPRRPPS